jgi:hypothetical protein
MDHRFSFARAFSFSIWAMQFIRRRPLNEDLEQPRADKQFSNRFGTAIDS